MKPFIFLLFFILGSAGLFGQSSGNRSGVHIHSTIREYNEEGTMISEINYENGQPKGSYKYFYETGIIMEEGEWNLDRQVGLLIRYDESGRMYQKFSFDINGSRVGDQLYFYPNGMIRAKKILNENNQAVRIIRYSEDGRQKSYINL